MYADSRSYDAGRTGIFEVKRDALPEWLENSLFFAVAHSHRAIPQSLSCMHIDRAGHCRVGNHCETGKRVRLTLRLKL